MVSVFTPLTPMSIRLFTFPVIVIAIPVLFPYALQNSFRFPAENRAYSVDYPRRSAGLLTAKIRLIMIIFGF